MEVRLAPSALSAANPSLRDCGAGSERSNTRIDTDYASTASGAEIPHLLSAASDEEGENMADCFYPSLYRDNETFDSANDQTIRGQSPPPPSFLPYSPPQLLIQSISTVPEEGLSDVFEGLLLRQREEANNRGQDSSSSIVFLGRAESSIDDPYPTQAARAPPPPSSESPTGRGSDDNPDWEEDGRSLLLKLSQSFSTESTPTSQPMMMMVDLDEEVDNPVPWMLSPSSLRARTKIFTSKLLARSQSPSPPAAAVKQLRSIPLVARHRRGQSGSSFSSISSHTSSIRSILRKPLNLDVDATDASTGGVPMSVLRRSPLIRKSENERENNGCNPLWAGQGSNQRVVSDKENPSHRHGRNTERRGETSSRLVKRSSAKNVEELSLVGENQMPASEQECAKSHRRTVSFNADAVQLDGTKSDLYPRILGGSGGDHDHAKASFGVPPPPLIDDPALTPLLDMGSSRSRRKFPSHVTSATDISPRTSQFLLSDSPAVLAMCEAQERGKYTSFQTHVHGLDQNKFSPVSKSHWTSSRSIEEIASNESFQCVRSNDGKNLLTVASADCYERDRYIHSLQDNTESKRRCFHFSSVNKSGKSPGKNSPIGQASVGMSKKFPFVGLLSPVEEASGSTMTPTPQSECTPLTKNLSPSVDELSTIRTPFESQKKFSKKTGRRTTKMNISPISNEIHNAAKVVWGTSTSPSSASSPKKLFPSPITGCHCAIS